MGPVIGMTPEKRAETPGAEKVAGLSQIYKMGSLPEAVDAARPKATLVDNESADDELTNLNWLHVFPAKGGEPGFPRGASLEGLPWWFRGKESACDAGDVGSIPGSGRSPAEGNGNPF